jgi:hypothetical protein
VKKNVKKDKWSKASEEKSKCEKEAKKIKWITNRWSKKGE